MTEVHHDINVFMAGFFSGILFIILAASLLVYLIKKDNRTEHEDNQ